MTDVLSMCKRMTIWTENGQVFLFVVASIFILMVNAKNLFVLCITTPLAALHKASGQYRFSYSGILGLPGLFFLLIYTFLRAVFSIMSRMSYKIPFAMQTLIRLFSFEALRLAVALPRAVFGLVAPRRNMRKPISTNTANSKNFLPFIKSLTAQRTKFRDFLSIGFYIVRLTASNAIFKHGVICL